MNWKKASVEDYARRLYTGVCMTAPERLQALECMKTAGAIIRKDAGKAEFAVIISGGSGNGPLFHGFVGDELADAAVVGAPYAAPNAFAIYETGKKLAGDGRGILLLYNNFAGDYLNNDMAAELLRLDGIDVKSVICTDDIASAVGEDKAARGGFCGVALLIKLAGACRNSGKSLEETVLLLEKANARLGTLSAHVDFEKSEIAFGAGFSGEPGIRKETHMDMRLCVEQACDMLLEELKPRADEGLYVLINRLRLTAHADGCIIAGYAGEYLSGRCRVESVKMGEYSSVADVYGFSITLLCADAELGGYLAGACRGDGFVL